MSFKTKSNRKKSCNSCVFMNGIIIYIYMYIDKLFLVPKMCIITGFDNSFV